MDNIKQVVKDIRFLIATNCCDETIQARIENFINERDQALRIHDVSRQSELLCDFLEWYDVDLTLEEREMEIKTYMDMKSHNC